MADEKGWVIRMRTVKLLGFLFALLATTALSFPSINCVFFGSERGTSAELSLLIKAFCAPSVSDTDNERPEAEAERPMHRDSMRC